MKDWAFIVTLIVGGMITGAGLSLLNWPPVELEFLDDEMTRVMICRMSTKRGVIHASCADLQAVVDAARDAKDDDNSL